MRRIIVGFAVAAALLGSLGYGVLAQESATPGTTSHAIVGAWLVENPNCCVISFDPDGTVLQQFAVSAANQQGGVDFISHGSGVWEPVDETKVHFTSVIAQSNAEGAFTGSITIDGFLTVSDDGQVIVDDRSESWTTIRDANHNIVAEIMDPTLPPVVGHRMAIGAPGFVQGTPASGTPTS